MKSNPRTLGKALDNPDPAIRLYLFHGYDPAQSRAHGERLLKALGAERVVLAGSSLKSDPAALADQAGAIGLFGGRRAIWIESAGEEIADAVEALLEAAAVESPVIAVAGPLKKSSRLLQLAEGDAGSLAHVSYELNERDRERLVEDLAHGEGLRLAPGIAARIAGAANGERGVIAQELTKLALYAGASPEWPQEVDSEKLEAVGAGSEGEWTRLGDVALSGDSAGLAEELARTPGIEPISVIRAIQRRLLVLGPMSARVAAGQRPHDVVASAGKSVFFKEKELVARLLSLWDPQSLARVAERVGQLERQLMRPDSPPDADALGQELVAIAQQAQKRR